MQSELISYLFADFKYTFSCLFKDCEIAFVNSLLIKLGYHKFVHGQVIQSQNHEADEVYFITSGSVAMCESTCFSEPVVIYTKGNVINLYQVILDKRLNFKYVAMDTSYLDVKATEEGEYFVTLSQDSIESFFLWPQRDSPGLRTKLGAFKSP